MSEVMNVGVMNVGQSVRATQIWILVFIFGWLCLSLSGNHFEETIEKLANTTNVALQCRQPTQMTKYINDWRCSYLVLTSLQQAIYNL